jgi:hypothetical protein
MKHGFRLEDLAWSATVSREACEESRTVDIRPDFLV